MDKKEIELIQLNVDNLTKFPMEILYHIQNGKKDFIIEYDYERLKLPLSKIADKITPLLLKTVQNYEITVGVKGFPRAIFEKKILRPNLRWYYENKVYFVDFSDKETYFNDEFQVPQEYMDKFGEKEIEPLVYNDELAELYEEEFEKFENEEIKRTSSLVLDDFSKDKFYKRKRIVLLKTLPRKVDEGYKERFVYYIYNRLDDFEKTFTLLNDIIQEAKLKELKEFLEKANEIVVSVALMNNDRIRKTLYFYTAELNSEEYKKLQSIVDLEFDTENLGGIGIDFYDDTFNIKTYYKYDDIKPNEIKEFISDYPLVNKRKILPVLNSCTKSLKHVLLDYKYKNGEIFSKRIDISMQYNIFKLHQLSNIFSEGLAILEDKEIYTISFEVSKDHTEKINFYYALKPKPEEEEIEQNNYYQYN